MVIVMMVFAPVVVAIPTVFVDFTAGQKRRRHYPQKHEKNRPSSSHDWVSFFQIQLIPLCHGGSFIPADSRYSNASVMPA